jgi:predicted NACHT family NTPase
LLDGLDEIPLKERETILKIIDNFTQVFYKNTIFITSRGTFDNYHFRGFNYVEIADFDDRQIKHFAHKWFSVNTLNKTEGNYKAEQFLEQLQHPENQPIRELGITPILLNLICSVFNEKLSFPCKRAKLYQAGLDILLKRWDRARGIQRDRVYYDLDLLDKIRLLCQIAATTFEQGKYFFETHDILSIIENYLHASPTLNPDLETLWLTSEAILKAIELQHGLLVERAKGIYSFSHLTFQEYLTARKIVSNSNSTLEEALKRLANHVLDLQWREVIYLTASMLPNADFLFQELQKNINKLLKQDSELDAFLGVINQKVMRLQVNCKKTAIRAFYFTIFQERDLNLAVTLDVNFVNKNLPEELNLDATLTRILTDCLMLVENSNFQKFLNLCFSLDLENRFQLTPAFKAAFRELKSQLPDITQGQETIETWWRTQGSDWVENYRSLLIEHRQIGHHWQLGQEHQALWHQYYLANLFLAQCLQSDCPMSPDVRQQIEATLLLPTSDLKAEG